jgi:hypothetical protein
MNIGSTNFVKTGANHGKKKLFKLKNTHVDDMTMHNFVKYLVHNSTSSVRYKK